jgi:polynucleotide 5'-kinase involved in rRNA processing
MSSDLEQVAGRVLAEPGVVFLLGSIDTGKTTAGIELLRRAAANGVPAALVDADIAQSTVGPPTTVGLRLCSEGEGGPSIETLRAADALAFVGSITPRGHLLPLVAATAKLVDRARTEGCELIVVDTTGFISGLYGQSLKFHKMELTRPEYVLAFQRGGELEPLIGIARRFTGAELWELAAGPEIEPRSVEDRMRFREQQFAAYFATGVHRWRVKPTVFMPTLPPEFDLALLEGMVVGMEDGAGGCAGIGVLEYDASEDMLRMVSPVTHGVRGLRLGSVRIDIDGRSRGPVDFRNLFRTE